MQANVRVLVKALFIQDTNFHFLLSYAQAFWWKMYDPVIFSIFVVVLENSCT